MSKNVFILLSIALVAVNATGLFNEVFTGDSALYATISKSLVESGNYADLYVQGEAWLDKPHFPFWMCALSFNIFGINTFAYKLPFLLFFLIGLFYTYRLAKHLYNTETAYLSTLILGSAMHIVVSNNDTRAEPILLGLIMGAVYHLYKLTLRFSKRDIILASLFSAAAVMTKGIFVLIVIYSAIFGHLLIKKEFGKLFNVKWLLVLLLTLIGTAPELYSVYTQFDMHPEVYVLEKTNVSGIKFFLWDSQFGRFFNTGPIKGKGDLFFFTHTLLWAYAPWAILGIAALIQSLRTMIRKQRSPEYLNLFGFMTMFILFSLSKFQLPHYMNIIFPFLAILTASLLVEKYNDKTISAIKKISINLYAIVSAIVVALVAYLFRPNDSVLPGIIILSGMLVIIVYFNFYKTHFKYKYVIYGFLSSMLLFVFLNVSFYPSVLKYQSGSKAAFYANKEYPTFDIVQTQTDYPLEFYTNNKIIHAYKHGQLMVRGVHSNRLVYADEHDLKELQWWGVKYTVINSFDYYHTTELSMEFINHKTREQALTKRYLIKILDPSQSR